MSPGATFVQELHELKESWGCEFQPPTPRFLPFITVIDTALERMREDTS